MRAAILTVAVGLGLGALSGQAAPLAPAATSIERGTAPPIELVDHACGWGLHRVHWQDHRGYWHWHCVHGHAQHGNGTRLEHPYSDWRGPSGGFGNP
jgi:hypothetical protein